MPLIVLREIERLINRLRQQLAAEPTMVDVAEATGLSLEEADERLRALCLSREQVSLDDPRERRRVRELRRLVAPPEGERLEDVEHRELLCHRLKQALDGLDPRQREIVRQRFGLAGGRCATLQELGDTYGISRERVRQLEVKALRKLEKLVGDRQVSTANGRPESLVRKLEKLVGDRQGPVASSRRDVPRPRPTTKPPAAAIARLIWFYHRNGYVRWQDPHRRSTEGWRSYKKGTEIRLVAKSRPELAEIRRLLKAAGFKPGRPFRKGRQFRQPVYGADQVVSFFRLIDMS